ncbi:hypothetical protein H4R18_005333 [Coemansia javaensis]|uniref:Uncharacterized protein n=1 Tax=Coemansia javaensis TaxID=2761396 RepID=A0A9W8H3H0_9FUNG|nr:hypothetical protein H4R18_005333 [Coemansia javaensis]
MRSRGDEFLVDLLGQATSVRCVQPEPKGGSQKHTDRRVVFYGTDRPAYIGGYTNRYCRSGIGNNLPNEITSGIGRQCFDLSGGWMTRRFSSIRRVTILRRGSKAPASASESASEEVLVTVQDEEWAASDAGTRGDSSPQTPPASPDEPSRRRRSFWRRSDQRH